MVQSCQYQIDCDTGLLTNYSSEGAEPFPPWYSVDYDITDPPPLDGPYDRRGCLYVCKSYISQEEADLCALRQSVLCTDTDQPVWYSAPATCSVSCPDGTTFYYTIPAGTFVANTYAEALAKAQEYACQKAVDMRICFNAPDGGGGGGGGGGGNITIGNLPPCACYGVFYSGTIEANGATEDQSWFVIGSIPPGLSFFGSGTGAVISGTPTTSGTFSFQVVATAPSGSYTVRTFTIRVLQITTASPLPSFTIGTPYSVQLQAAGGTGNYIWSVATGTLPAGLSLSTSGLISGTPTALATGGTLTFAVRDTACS